MKKEEIDDRLMDALLRGKSEEDLGAGVEENEVRKIHKGNLVRAVLGIAAMALLAALGVFSWKQNQSGGTEGPVLTTAPVDEVKRAEQELAALDAEIEAQKKKVEAKRKVLDSIVRITGRPYFEGARNSPESTETRLTMMAERNAFEMKKNRDQYGVYLDKLETLDSEQALQYAAELPVDNNSVRSLHTEYQTQSRELEALKSSGLSESHPAIAEQKERVERLKGDLSSGVETLKKSLSTNHEMISEQLLVMENTSQEQEAELVSLATEMHDYREATREYESSLALLQELKLKHASERVALRTPGESPELKELPPVAMQANKPTAPTLALSSPAEGALNLGSPTDYGTGWGEGSIVGSREASLVAARRVHGVMEDDVNRAKMAEIEAKLEQLKKENLAIREGNSEKYGQTVDQPWKDPRKEALSTFSVDVDTASYTNLRRLLMSGSPVPRDAVRIEELVNYFDYNYPQPDKGEAFGVGLEMATCPWEPKHNLVRVALQGKDIKKDERGDANLVFLVDVSGSMQDSDKLPLLVESLGLLVEELQEEDRVTIVVYAGSQGLALEPTKMGQGGREKVAAALGKLSAGGSTNGGAGIELAYRLAKENFVTGGINRVILATDGDFNVGTTSREALVELVKKEAQNGIFLSVCGFGRGNLNDSMLEAITNDGNGVYYYVDSLAEGRRVFLEKLMGTLVTIAKDVKIQVEFNPAKVGQYRLIGYANRVLKKEDFNNDQVDAGDIGSGHQVTAFYEIVPADVTDTVRPEVDDLKYQSLEEVKPANNSPDWMTVKLRHKAPDGEISKLQEFVLQGRAKPWAETDGDFQFASGVALWGMSLRGMVEPVEQRAKVLELIRGSIVAGYEEGAGELLELIAKQ